MIIPNVNIRDAVYGLSLVIAAVVGLLGTLGVIPLATAGAIGTVVGAIGNALAKRTVSQQKKDGTLVLTGSVENQVTKGTDILINEVIEKVNGLDQVGRNLDKLNKVKDEALATVDSIPVVGPLTRKALDILT